MYPFVFALIIAFFHNILSPVNVTTLADLQKESGVMAESSRPVRGHRHTIRKEIQKEGQIKMMAWLDRWIERRPDDGRTKEPISFIVYFQGLSSQVETGHFMLDGGTFMWHYIFCMLDIVGAGCFGWWGGFIVGLFKNGVTGSKLSA